MLSSYLVHPRALAREKSRLITMKSIIIAAAAAPFIAAPAMAGPYVNVEANTGWVGSDYEGTVIESHVGYEGDLGENAVTTSKLVLLSSLKMAKAPTLSCPVRSA